MKTRTVAVTVTVASRYRDNLARAGTEEARLPGPGFPLLHQATRPVTLDGMANLNAVPSTCQ
jgi:hypothetical protein